MTLEEIASIESGAEGLSDSEKEVRLAELNKRLDIIEAEDNELTEFWAKYKNGKPVDDDTPKFTCKDMQEQIEGLFTMELTGAQIKEAYDAENKTKSFNLKDSIKYAKSDKKKKPGEVKSKGSFLE